MKLLSITISVSLAFTLSAQTAATIQLNGNSLLYHKIETTVSPKKGLLIFMHGGVSQFNELDAPIEISPEAVVEGNQDFLSFAQSLGYDVILPIAYNEYNWMEKAGQQFVLALVEQHSAANEKIIISGFSDGGTGAYQIFYSYPECFDGVMIFNGYPQHNNFYQKVDYTKGKYKPVLFASTKNDKRIPYEFLLTAYRRQKIVNQNTYFHLAEGGHSFAAYSKSDIEKYFTVIGKPRSIAPASSLITIYPPIDGWMENDTLKEVYPFRKSAVKKYRMEETEYSRNDYNFKEYQKLISINATLYIPPVQIPDSELKSAASFPFQVKTKTDTLQVNLTNWLILKAWP